MVARCFRCGRQIPVDEQGKFIEHGIDYQFSRTDPLARPVWTGICANSGKAPDYVFQRKSVREKE